MPFLALSAIVFSFFFHAAACSSPGSSSSRELKSGRIDGAPADITVGLLLENDKLTVIGTAAPRELDEAPRPFTTGDALLFWELTNESGAIAGSGALLDPRRSSAEMDENGDPSPLDATHASAMFEITIPNVGGTIHLYDAPKRPSPTSGGVSTQSTSIFGSAEIASPAPIAAVTDGEPASDLLPAERSNDLGNGLRRIVDGSRCGDDFRILVVPEGYTDMEAFARDAQAVAASFGAIAGYSEHASQISVYTQDFTSTDEGISDPDNAVTRNTAFNASFGRGDLRRCIFPHNGIPSATAASLFVAKERAGADVVVMIANTNEYGGCAQASPKMIAVTRHASAEATLGHEMGHALFGLSDEYAGGGVACNARGADTPNTGNNLRALPWRAMLTTDELPSTGGDNATVGAFEGARYCAKGVYRPSPNCKMRQSTVDFCPVCKARVDETFQARTAARRVAGCTDAGAEAGARVRPDAGAPRVPDAGRPDAGQRPEQPRLYDSCTGRKDGVYCSELVDFSAIVCEGESIKEGQQCGGGKCTGPNGAGKTIQCSGTGSDAPNVDSCAGRANGVYCSQVASDFAIVCTDGTISGGLNCPNEGQKCSGPNGAGTAIACR